MNTTDIKDPQDGIKQQVENNIDTKVNEPLAAMQKHLDLLDVKMQQAGANGTIQKTPIDLKTAVSKAIQSKEAEIKDLTNNTIQVKSVLTTSVTGGLDHTFRDQVVMKPGHLVNVTDLIPSVQTMGGSYSYAIETVTGSPAIQVEGEAKAVVDISFDYDTCKTEFIASVTDVSRQFLNNFQSLRQSIPSILEREFYFKLNTLYATEIRAKATATTITGDNEIDTLTKVIADMMGKNISPTVVVLNPVDYTALLLNKAGGSEEYDLPNVVTISPTGLVSILGVPVVMAVWQTAGAFLVMNGNKVVQAVQENMNFQIDGSEKFSKNLVVMRLEQQSWVAVMAPAEVVKGTF